MEIFQPCYIRADSDPFFATLAAATPAFQSYLRSDSDGNVVVDYSNVGLISILP